jgi:acyl-CoA thioester hydrolase
VASSQELARHRLPKGRVGKSLGAIGQTLTRRPGSICCRDTGKEGKMAERLELLRAVVHPWHQDHFGHMNVRHYAPFFDDATYHLWTRVGLPYSTMLAEHGVHCVTVQATTQFRKELVAGDLIMIDGVVARLGTKSVGFELAMRHADTGALHATYEITEVFFDPAARSSTAMPASVRSQLERWLVPPG